MRALIFILTILLTLGDLEAQNYHSSSRKAVRLLEEADGLYRQGNNSEAENLLLKAIGKDPDFVEAYQLLSQVCFEDHRLEEAIHYFSTGLEKEGGNNPEGFRLLAGLVLKTGDYERALELADHYFSFPAEEQRFPDRAREIRNTCHFALHALKNPVPFEPVNLGPGVNSEMSEYWPSLTVDERQLMFTVLLPSDSAANRPSFQADLSRSQRDEGSWSKRENLGSPPNTSDNEGAQSMTAGGEVLFFTACNRRDGKGRCDLYMTIPLEKGWSRAINLGGRVNTPYSEKHPSISADGRYLYFSSDRPGGKGSYDIWYCKWEEGAWSEARNLGDSVNTPGLEQSPFIHADQQSLYFSSTGWPGMGESDLFISRQGPGGTWSRARNLGYPVNTFNDEIGLSVNARGDRAYFASDRLSGRDTDLYSFEMPVELRPMEVSYFSGRVFDSENMKGLEATISLIDLESGESIMELSTSRRDGSFMVPLPAGKDYALNASAPGYLFHSAHFPLREVHSQLRPFKKDIPLDRIREGKNMTLENIFFEIDSDSLLPASLAELERVVSFLKKNPEVIIEIRGHTDNTGSEAHNQDLSEQRARSVVAYLAGKGIPEGRLMAGGAGDREPLAGNDSEEGRAMNRRTEMRIARIGL